MVVEYVAGATGGKLATSETGIHWIQRTSSATGTNKVARAVAYSPDLDQWISSANDEIFTSPDGITWTSRGTPYEFGGIASFDWSPELGLWIAVGGISTGLVATSPDGVSWSSASFGTDWFWDAVWVGPHGKFYLATSGGGIVSSTNGTTFTLEATHASSPNLRAIAYSPSLDRVIAGGDSGLLLSRLSDGTYQSHGVGSSRIDTLSWAPSLGLFLQAGTNLSLATSPDGTTWISRESGFGTSDQISGSAWSEALGLWVIVGGNSKLATSPDGITWTLRASNFGGNFIHDVAARWTAAVSPIRRPVVGFIGFR